MKTAMQELIDNLKQLSEDKFNDKIEFSDFIKTQEQLIEIGLEKEKKQITDACWYGHDIKHEYFNPIHYFDQTYSQNK